jgi:hypothetical protein
MQIHLTKVELTSAEAVEASEACYGLFRACVAMHGVCQHTTIRCGATIKWPQGRIKHCRGTLCFSDLSISLPSYTHPHMVESKNVCKWNLSENYFREIHFGAILDTRFIHHQKSGGKSLALTYLKISTNRATALFRDSPAPSAPTLH